MKKNITIGCLAAVFFAACQNAPQEQSGTKVDTNDFVEDLLAKMTIEEKAGQMAQLTLDVITEGPSIVESYEPLRLDTAELRHAIVDLNLGSILNTANNRARTPEVWNTIINQIQEMATKETRLGIPVLYGIDAIHGASYTAGATMFPQQIGQAASFNPSLVEKAGQITAYETRASSIPWTFSPVLDLGIDARNPRIWETYGEDVYLASVLGHAIVKGYEGQSNDISQSTAVAACLKHFLGYSAARSGKDRTPAIISTTDLYEYHVPVFKAGVDAGAHSVMLNSSLINGIPVHASYDIITKLLKEELGFQGLVVTDWADIENLYKRDKIAKDHKEAIKLSINAGVDLAMIPYQEEYVPLLIQLIKEGAIPESRINDAVRRILKVKYDLGLFTKPSTKLADYPKFGSKEHEAVAYELAAESITLLKNQGNILPLPKSAKVLVTGPNAHSMRTLNGGWSYSWQGEKVEEFAQNYKTILEALEDEISKNQVSYVAGVEYNMEGKYYEETETGIAEAVAAAKKSDYIILCLGENSYTEKPGDLHDLSLSALQIKLAKELAATGKPIILVLNEGRPRLISSIEPQMKGIVNIYLPGNHGGVALADILFGDINPSGKLPYTYPLYPNTLINYNHKPSESQAKPQGMYDYSSDYAVQYEFGYGLSYTQFEYSNLQISDTVISSAEKSIQIKITIANKGNRAGKETVQLYISDLMASLSPDVKRLRAFEKISLEAGQSKEVVFNITAKDLAFVNKEVKRITEAGTFKINIGGQETNFEVSKDLIDN